MSKPPWIKDEEVRQKIPPGQQLPAQFEDLVSATPNLRLQWSDLQSFGVVAAAHDEMLPFLRTSTGGVVALWYRAADPAVVHFGDEGGLTALASNFAEFLHAIVAQDSGLPDIDDA